MFTPLDNKAVINSYSALRHEREMYAVIRKENVCVCVLYRRYSKPTLIPRYSDIDMEDINTGDIEICDLYFCLSLFQPVCLP